MSKAKKRNYITEILEVKGRVPPANTRWAHVNARMARIERVVSLLDFLREVAKIEFGVLDEVTEIAPELIDLPDYAENTYELARYIPIALVACIEGFFRLVYTDLIEEDEKCRINVAKFEIQFSLEHLVSIEKNSVSLGEFVSHFLPCSSIDNIHRNMTTLTEEDFLKVVKEKHRQLTPSLFPDLFTGELLISQIKEVFTYRHMYCHEIRPPMSGDDFAKIQSFHKSVSQFLLISEYITEELLPTKRQFILSQEH